MSDRQVKVSWEIDAFPENGESEYQIAKKVYQRHFKGPPDSDTACVFKVVEGDIVTMVDLGFAEESREQRLERLARLLLSQMHDTDEGRMESHDLFDDDNPVTRQMKALL